MSAMLVVKGFNIRFTLIFAPFSPANAEIGAPVYSGFEVGSLPARHRIGGLDVRFTNY